MDSAQYTEMRDFSALIERIYHGATNPGAWPEIIQDIAAWMGAPKIILFTPQIVPAAGGFMFPHGLTQRFFELWPTHHKPMDLWVERAVARGLIVQGAVVVGEELVPAAELAASRWYREVLATENIFHETRVAIDSALGNAIEPMAQAVPHFAQSVRVRRPSGQLPYALQFSSLASNNEFGQGKDAPQVIVFISDPVQEIQVDPELLRKTYGLTPAEIRVAVTLCQEGSIDEAAAKLGVTASTVKSQLKQVYQKTGVDNRIKLTRLIVSLATVC